MGHNLEPGFKARERERIGLKTLSSPPKLSFGRELVEVLSISYKGRGDPSCNIIVYDGKRGQIIYKQGCSSQADRSPSLRPSNPGTQNANNHCPLLLTGPYRVISLDGCVVLEYNIDDRCHDEILLDIDDPSTKYNEAVTEELGCTCNNHPRAVVTYALLSNAVEAIVEVKLHQQRDNTFYGRIIARSYLGEVVLFESNYENMLIGSSREATIIPLARSVLAVPLDSSLQIEVDLHDQSNGKIVKGLATCQADLNSNHVLHLDGEDGQVDVKITWSD